MKDYTIDSIRECATAAKGIAFDGCHKIYILMDDPQMAKMKEYGYGDDDGSFLIADMNADEMTAQVLSWYEDSCALKFVNAVGTVEGDLNDGFESIVPQGYDDDFCKSCEEELNGNYYDGLCEGCAQEDAGFCGECGDSFLWVSHGDDNYDVCSTCDEMMKDDEEEA